MSNLLKAQSTRKVNGSPVSKEVETVEFIGQETMNGEAGIGGGLTYFNGKFHQVDFDGGTDKPIHKVEAYIADLSSDAANNSATGYLSAKLNSQNDNAQVEVQTYIIAEMSTLGNGTDNNYQMFNRKYHNNDTIGVQFGSDVQEVQYVLRGFSVSFNSEHHVKKLTATINNANFNSSQSFTGEVVAKMIDDSGNTGAGDIFTSLIGSNMSNTPWKKTTWNPGDGATTVSFTGDSPLETAYVFIQGIQLKYKSNDDHKVKKMTIDTGTENLFVSRNEQNSDGSYSWEVTFNPKLEMKDDSGNSESHSDSYLDLLVVFVPQS